MRTIRDRSTPLCSIQVEVISIHDAILYIGRSHCQKQIIIIKIGRGSAGMGESGLHRISPKTPALQYQPVYRRTRKGKIIEDYSSDRAAQANEKAQALLFKPSSPAPPNTGSARQFQMDTKRGIKALRYCEVLQRGIE